MAIMSTKEEKKEFLKKEIAEINDFLGNLSTILLIKCYKQVCALEKKAAKYSRQLQELEK